MLIGVDYHPSFQQIAFLVEETGEYSERRLNHSDGEAAKFYRDLKQREVRVRVGMEATGCWLKGFQTRKHTAVFPSARTSPFAVSASAPPSAKAITDPSCPVWREPGISGRGT